MKEMTGESAKTYTSRQPLLHNVDPFERKRRLAMHEAPLSTDDDFASRKISSRKEENARRQ